MAQQKGDDGVGAEEGPVHAAAFETSTDHGFALGFDHAGGDAEAEGAESWVVHPVLVGVK